MSRRLQPIALYTVLFIAVAASTIFILHTVLWGPTTKPWDYAMGPPHALPDWWLAQRSTIYIRYAPLLSIFTGVAACILVTVCRRWNHAIPRMGYISFLPFILAELTFVWNPPLAILLLFPLGIVSLFGIIYSLVKERCRNTLLSIPFNVLWLLCLFFFMSGWYDLIGD